MDEDIQFFANYTLTNGTAIGNSTGEGGNCSIEFGTTRNMTFNISNSLWHYNRSFSSSATYDFNVSCNSSYQLSYVNLTDNIVLTSKPVISAVTAAPNPQGYGLNVSVDGTITDGDGQIDIHTVLVEIDAPDLSPTNFTMTNVTSTLWSYNYTDFTNGSYNYRIFANDSSGYLTTSSVSSFEMYINLSIGIRTLKENYSLGRGQEY